MSSFAKRLGRKLVAIALMLGSVAAIADTVVINGSTWSCEHACVVELGPNGFMLSDSKGGWLRKLGPAKPSLAPRI